MEKTKKVPPEKSTIPEPVVIVKDGHPNDFSGGTSHTIKPRNNRRLSKTPCPRKIWVG